jgi:hypothetical protein
MPLRLARQTRPQLIDLARYFDGGYYLVWQVRLKVVHARKPTSPVDEPQWPETGRKTMPRNVFIQIELNIFRGRHQPSMAHDGHERRLQIGATGKSGPHTSAVVDRRAAWLSPGRSRPKLSRSGRRR